MPRNAKQEESDRIYLTSLLATAQTKGWYGTLEIMVEGGEIKRVRKIESLIPPKAT